jgi:hypothetical protein
MGKYVVGREEFVGRKCGVGKESVAVRDKII